ASMVGYDETRTRTLYRGILDRMAGVPGVESAAFASIVSFGELSENRHAYVPGVTTEFRPQFLIVSSSYFDTLRLPVLRGRGLQAADDEPSTRRPSGSGADGSRPIPAVVD